MDIAAIEKETRFLGKDATELASDMLKLDASADISVQQSMVSKAAAVDLLLQEKSQIITECLSTYQNATDINGEGIEKAIRESLNERLQNADISGHRFISEFEASIEKTRRQISASDDDMEVDMIEVNSENRYKCPITGELFANPVKNKACGHTYSKEGIMSLLKSKKTVNCPVAGCGKKVSENSLIPDDDMVWKMEQLNLK